MKPQVSFLGKEHHGRNVEKRRILSLFEQSNKESQYMLISGQSGIGKSSLVESTDWETTQKCFFAVGRFDQTDRAGHPFSAFSEILLKLCEEWISTEEGKIEVKMFEKKHCANESILTSMLPSIFTGGGADRKGLLRHHQSSLALMNTKTSFERLRTQIFKLLKSVTNPPARSIVIMFDDLQWADEQNLGLIQFLVEENIPGLFILGTHMSDSESSSQDNIRNHIEYLLLGRPNVRSRVHQLQLNGLEMEEVNAIFSKLTNKSPDATRSLVEVVHEKTAGSPLFIEQFFRLLQKEKYLRFSIATFQWEWSDAEEIRKAMSITSGEVASVIASSMKELDQQAQAILKVASCLGSHVIFPILESYFSIFSLMEHDFAEQESKETCLEDLLEELVCNQILKTQTGSALYHWTHNKVQQAAASLVSEHEKHQIHLQIGKLALHLSREPDNQSREVFVYVAADQLNKIPTAILANEGNEFLMELAEINLQAGEFSIAKSAFYPAANLLRSGIKLLQLSEENSESFCHSSRLGLLSLSDHYHVALGLLQNLAETCYIIGEHEESKQVIQEILFNSHSETDKYRARLCLLEITVNGKDRDERKGVQMCLDFLQPCGIDLPIQPSRLRIRRERRRLKRMLPTGQLKELLYVPFCTDHLALCVANFLATLSNRAAVVGLINLSICASLKALQHALKYGTSSYTVLSLATYALTKRLSGKTQKAYLLGDTAASLSEAFKENSKSEAQAKVLVVLHNSVLPLRKPLQTALDPFLQAYRFGMQTGDVEFGLIGAMCYAYHYFFCGLPLRHLESDAAAYGNEARQLGLAPSVWIQFPIFHTCAQVLMGKRKGPWPIDEFLLNLSGKAESMTLRDIYIFQLMEAFVYRDFDVLSEKVEKLSFYPTLNPNIARVHLRQAFTGLAAFAICQKDPSNQKMRTTAQKALRYFKDAVRAGSSSAYPIYALLLAEKAPSKKAYDEAIRVCSRSGLKNFEAIANESCALYFWRVPKDDDWAKYYMSRALLLYEEWEAHGKAAALQEEYPFLVDCDQSPALNIHVQGKETHSGGFMARASSVKFDHTECSISASMREEVEDMMKIYNT